MKRATILWLAPLLPASFLLAPDARAGTSCETSSDIKLSEVLINPDGGDTDKEWVELYNAGDETVDLTGWRIEWFKSSSFSGSDIPAATTIGDDGFLVLGESKVGEADVTIGLDMGNGTDGDGVYLVDCEGTIVDAIVYTSGSDVNDHGAPDESGKASAWYVAGVGEGEVIARTSPSLDTDSAADFCLSEVATPGEINDCGGGGDTGGGDGGGDDTGDPLPSECPLFSDVVINEFVSDPDGSDGGYEWVELYNASGAQIDLTGYLIAWEKGSSGGDAALPDALTIRAGGFLLVGEASVKGADVVVELDLGNGGGGDGIYLVDPDGCPVDAVIYGESNDDGITNEAGEVAATWVENPSSGASAARLQDGYDTNNSRDDFVLTSEPSPGAANPYVEPPVCEIDGADALVINELLPDPDGGDDGYEWVELYNAGNRAFRLDGWMLEVGKSDWSGDIDYIFGGGVEIGPGEFLVIGGEGVPQADFVASSLSMGNGSDGDGVRLVDCLFEVVDTVVYGGSNEDLLEDDSGDVAESVAGAAGSNQSLARRYDGEDSDLSGADFWITDELTPGAPNPPPPVCSLDGVGAITLNEFLPNPEGSDDGVGGVELYNASGQEVRLDGWMIETATSEWKGSVEFSFPADAVIEAGGFVVIGAEEVVDFTPDYVAEGLSLGNGSSGDGLRLLDCEGNIADTVIYSSDGTNDDELTDDSLAVAASPALMPDENASLGRYPDGTDSGVHSEDWIEYGTPSPGAPNEAGSGSGGTTTTPSGCGCRGGPEKPEGVGGGCTTVPFGGLTWGFAAFVAVLRRRREEPEPS